MKELYLIPVPLSDDTTPAEVLPATVLETVREIRCFFVENLRSARRFLRSVDRDFDIDSSQFYTVDEHTTPQELGGYTEVLMRSTKAAMISEAGCPAVADPGASLVELARANGFRIRPMVGPSSIILSLMASGFNGQNFTFHGYLPYDGARRQRLLNEMTRNIDRYQQTQIFIETPYRNNRLITELSDRMPGNMKLCVACMLTSPDEEIIVRSIAEWKKSSFDFSKRPAIFLLSN